MAATAYQTQYSREQIAAFEQRKSLLLDTVTTDYYRQEGGNTVTFLVEGSGSATAVTRGADGLIPARNQSLTQASATLSEWHDLPRRTGFNIWASQGGARARQNMQRDSVGVINRKIDGDIITQLATGTVNTGVAAPASVAQFQHAMALLGAASVPWDGNITLLCSSGYLGYLQQAPEFSSADYVTMRPMEDGGDWRDMPQAMRWRNVLIIAHPQLTLNTSAEEAYLYHKTAVGYAADMENASVMADYNEEQDYSWARCSVFMGAKKLQNSGIVVINHDASALAAG